MNNYDKNTLPGREHRTVEISRLYKTIYSSTNEYGAAFGEVMYVATKNSVVVSFTGGSNFQETVTELSYTISENNNDSVPPFEGKYTIGEKNKYFEVRAGSDDHVFVINHDGFSIPDDVLIKQFAVTISVKIKIPDSNNTVVLTSAEVPGFSGLAPYAKEDKTK
jgi:hypothetical protein